MPMSRSLLLALLLVSGVYPATCLTGHIGFLAGLSEADQTSMGWFWKRAAAVGLMAIHHINTRNPVLVPEATALLRDFNVTYTIRDTMSNPPTGVQAALEMTEEGAQALVGAVRSAVSGPASLVAGIFGIPVISFASTSKELADKLSYPSFSRTCPSDALTAFAMVDVSASLGWSSVAIIAMNDPYGRGYAQELESSCGKLGVDVSVNVRYVSGDTSSIETAISAIQLADARVVLLVVFEADLRDILTIGHRQGVIGSGYTWVVSDSIVEVPMSAEDLHERMHGWLSVIPATLDADRQRHFQQVWDAQEKAMLMDPIFGDVAEAAWLEGPLISLHAHMYEAVWAAALALSASHVTGADGNQTLDKARLNRQVREQVFHGPTGLVELDAVTGDRAPGSLSYEVLSWKPVADARGQVSAGVAMQAVWQWSASGGLKRIEDAEPPYWAGVGTTWTAPPDGSSCRPGEVLGAESLQCEPCPRGEHQEEARCVPCEVGTYGPEEGLTKCIRCTLGYSDQPGQHQCLACPPNTARPAGSAGVSVLECECTYGHYAPSGAGQACVACVAGAHCPGGRAQPQPLPGFWADRACSLDPQCAGKDMFFPCVPARKCRGGPEFECEAGFVGRMCQEVEPGYFEVGGLWRFECGANGKWINLVGIVGVVTLWTGIKKVAASNYYALKIGLLYIQVTGMVSACGMRWHRSVEFLNTALSIFNFGVDFMSPHCLGNWTAVHRFYIQLLLPFIYVLLHVLGIFVWRLPSVLWARGGPRKSLRETMFDAASTNELIRSSLSFSILVYHTLCISVFQAFRCRLYPDGNSYLLFDPAVQCWQPQHVGMLVVAVFYFLVVLLGLPAFMLHVTHAAKRDGRLHDAKVMARYGFFYVRYRTEFKWWECLIMVRRFAIALVYVVVEPPMLQAALAVGVLLGLLMVHSHSRPFIMKKIDYLEIFALAGTILYALAGMLFYPSITPEAQGVLCLKDEAGEACEAESTIKLGIAVVLLVGFGFTLLLAIAVAGTNISQTINQHRAHRTIKHLFDADEDDESVETQESPRHQQRDGLRTTSSAENSSGGIPPLNGLQSWSSMRLEAASKNKVSLEALLSGTLLLRWSSKVKRSDESEQRKVMEHWNHVRGVISALPHDVTHFSASPIAVTLRVLAQLPAIEDFLSVCSAEDRRSLFQTVISYSRFREQEADGETTSRYHSAGLVENEHKPVMLCAMMYCDSEEHAQLTALLDSILAVAAPHSPGRRGRLKPRERSRSSSDAGLNLPRHNRHGGESESVGRDCASVPVSAAGQPLAMFSQSPPAGSSESAGSGVEWQVSARLGTLGPGDAALPAQGRLGFGEDASR